MRHSNFGLFIIGIVVLGEIVCPENTQARGGGSRGAGGGHFGNMGMMNMTMSGVSPTTITTGGAFPTAGLANSVRPPANGSVFFGGGGGYGGEMGGFAGAAFAAPVPMVAPVAQGPVQVTTTNPFAKPTAFSERQFFTNGIATTVVSPLVTEYNWPETAKASSERTFARQFHEAPLLSGPGTRAKVLK
jgi:hypothetical protein